MTRTSVVNQNNSTLIWDGYGLDNPYSGVYRYAQALYGELSSCGVKPSILHPPYEIDHAFWEPCKLAQAQNLPRIFRSKMAWAVASAKYFSEILKRESVGDNRVVYHGLSNINLPAFPPNKSRVKYVITVHDLIPLLTTGCGALHTLQFRALIKGVMRRAHAVVCISQWARDTVVSRFPWVEHKVHVIPNGFPSTQFLEGGMDRASKNIRFISIGRGEPYKNLGLLLDLLAFMPSLVGTIVTDPRGRAFLTESLSENRRYAELRCSRRLVIKTSISSDELKALINSSQVYIQPSFFEGFCLPAAEALSHGLPILYMRGHAMEEVFPDTVSVGLRRGAPVAEWIDGVKRAAALGQRPEHLQEVSSFLHSSPSWRNSAEQLLSLYNNL